MDPITQGLLGGVAAQAVSKKEHVRMAGAAGFFAAVLPDLDLLIRSTTNPLMGIFYHRHFTHALIFIPVGGTLAALVFWLVRRRRVSFPAVLWAAVIGYATHGLLDAFTSYGTVLYWPFSLFRVAWDAIPIIYLYYTLGLLVSWVLALWYKAKWPSYIALLLTVIFIGGGGMQRNQAIALQEVVAAQRGHVRERGRVLPAINSLILWRSIYESGDRIYIDAIEVKPFHEPRFKEGGSVLRVDVESFSQSLRSEALSDALARYEWFADGYLSWVSMDPPVFGDSRFAVMPDEISPLWGIEVNPESGTIKKRRFYRISQDRLARWWERMLQGTQGLERVKR